MNRRMLLIGIMFLFALWLPAQEEEESVPLRPRKSVPVKIGGAGGFTQYLLFLDIGPINDYLKIGRAAPIDNQPLFLLGGEGYGYIMLVPNLRIGGLGASGSIESASVDTSVYPNMRRDFELSVAFGGMTIEYVIPVIPKLDISAGIMLGAGSTTLKIWRNQNSNKIWDDTWRDFGNNQSSTFEYSRSLNGAFFVYQPQVNIEYAIMQWVGLRLGVAYNGMAGASWKQDDKYDLVEVPSAISGKGLMINAGIFLGTFIY